MRFAIFKVYHEFEVFQVFVAAFCTQKVALMLPFVASALADQASPRTSARTNSPVLQSFVSKNAALQQLHGSVAKMALVLRKGQPYIGVIKQRE